LFPEQLNCYGQPLIDHRQGMPFEVLRDAAIKCLGHSSCNARQGVSITSKRNGVADGIVEAGGLQDRNQRFGHSPLACLVKAVRGPDLVELSVEIVTET